MNRLLFTLLLLNSVTIHTALPTAQQGLIVVPVADLVGQSFSTLCSPNKIITTYKNIPLSGKSGVWACPRIMQALFNETVTILEAHKDEVCIAIPHFYFQTKQNNKKYSTYWTMKSNLIPLETIKQYGIDTKKIPQAIRYAQADIETVSENIVTLIHPFYDAFTDQTYSAGTRFVINNESLPDPDYYSVFIFDPKIKIIRTIKIPHKKSLLHRRHTEKQKINLFLQILKRWIGKSTRFIPYVWGGCSFVQHCTDNKFLVKTDIVGKKIIEFFQYPEIKTWPKTGFDCAGVVARAAQIAGIPYFYKNTFTLSKNMATLKPEEKIEPGDLIWIPGHVMIVSDIDKNLLIEARAYGHGYGKLQEIPIAHEFAGITTYNQLINHFFTHQKLDRLDKDGKKIQQIKNFKILKLISVWQTGTNN